METNKNQSTRKAAKIAILLVILLMVTNAAKLPFLSEGQRQAVAAFMNQHFSQAESSMANLNLDAGTLLSLVIMLAVVWIAEQIIVMILDSFGGKRGKKATVRKLMISFVKYASLIIGMIWGLAILGVNVAAIFAGVGVISLVIGFGAESLIEDIITGLFIIFEGQYSVGDIVCIDGFRGTVSAIGVRTTHIVDLGGNIKIINNSSIRNIQNLSSRNSMAVSDISISYNQPLEEAEAVVKETLLQIQEAHPEVFPNPLVYLGVQELAASSVDLRITAVVDEPNIYAARRIMNRELKLAFDRNHIEIPFPQLVIHQEP